MRFSERFDHKESKIEIQKDDIDIDLKNSLWNCLKLGIFDKFDDRSNYITPPGYDLKENLADRLWLNYFKEPIDNRPDSVIQLVGWLKNWFYNNCEWYDIYDFIEFIIANHSDPVHVEAFVEKTNLVLKRELSGYRIVSSVITPITSESDLAEIKKASENPIKEVGNHFTRALELLSDRKNPDYRNSIKESISAVETMCKRIAGNDKATLGDALSKIQKDGKVQIHKALHSAYGNLYGYTNDADGIRHSLMDETNLDIEDALFMLTSCSAFVNYLVEKVAKSGLKI